MKQALTVTAALATLLTIAAAAPSALAGPFTPNVSNDVYSGVVNGIPTARDNNDGVPDIYQAINQLLGTALTGNAGADSRFVPVDAVWTNLTGKVALIGLTAGNSNTLGVYTGLGTGGGPSDVIGPHSGFGFLGNGTAGSPYPAASTGLLPGVSHGWYLTSVSGASSLTFYSEPGLNTGDGGLDHLMTFALPELAGQSVWINEGGNVSEYTFTNPYLLAWEDLPFNGQTLGDDDYDDMIYLVDAVSPTVPEPGSLLLMAAGLLGLWRVRSRR